MTVMTVNGKKVGLLTSIMMLISFIGLVMAVVSITTSIYKTVEYTYSTSIRREAITDYSYFSKFDESSSKEDLENAVIDSEWYYKKVLDKMENSPLKYKFSSEEYNASVEMVRLRMLSHNID